MDTTISEGKSLLVLTADLLSPLINCSLSLLTLHMLNKNSRYTPKRQLYISLSRKTNFSLGFVSVWTEK